ncbi:MAG: dihydrodipicolinate synthase family protein, partial [Ramlibacter sp.]
TVRIKGGLLGHWSVWTKRAVELLDRIHAVIETGDVTPELLALDAQVTDCNGALFDVAHDFHGCIAGCHEVLRRQGVLESIACLDPHEGLSAGQADEISRVQKDYPHLVDDEFVAAHRERWLG